MATYLVLTIIGEDRPGIVELLAKIISDHSGNWLESSMSQLAGKFAGVEISIYSFLLFPVFRFFKIFDSGLGYAINCNLGKLFGDNIYD